MERNLIANGDFESGPPRWIGRGNCIARIDRTTPHSGSACLFTTNRTQPWEGPSFNLLPVMLSPDQAYRVTVWIRSEAGSSDARITLQTRCVTEINPVYKSLQSTLMTETWSELTTVLTAPTCPEGVEDLLEAVIYVEAAFTGPTASFYIDDTTLVEEL